MALIQHGMGGYHAFDQIYQDDGFGNLIPSDPFAWARFFYTAF